MGNSFHFLPPHLRILAHYLQDKAPPEGDDSIQETWSPIDFLPVTEMAGMAKMGAGAAYDVAAPVARNLLADEAGVLKFPGKKDLNMNELPRKMRAIEQGIDTEKRWYHGTPNGDFMAPDGPGEFKTNSKGANRFLEGTYFTDKPRQASGFSSSNNGFNTGNGPSGGAATVVPAVMPKDGFINIENPEYIDNLHDLLGIDKSKNIDQYLKNRISATPEIGGLELLKKSLAESRGISLDEANKLLPDLLSRKGVVGFDVPSYGVRNVLRGNENKIRSPWAEFNPAKTGSKNISSGIGAAALGAGGLAASGSDASANEGQGGYKMESVKKMIGSRMGSLPALDEEDDILDDKTPYDSVAKDGAQLNETGDPSAQMRAPAQQAPMPQAPAPQAPMPQSSPMADYDAQEAKAQQIREQTRGKNNDVNMYRALAQLAGATSSKPVDGSQYDSMIKQNDADATASAGDLTRRASVMKAIQAAQAKEAAAKTLALSREGIASDNRDARLEAAKNRDQDRKDALGTKASDKQNQTYNQTVQQLEQMRGSPAAAQAEKDIYASQKVNSLIKQFAPDGDLNKLTGQQAKLLQSEVAKIASGGTASIEELRNLDPATLTGKMSKVWSELSNDPTPANAGKFLSSYKDYADRVSGDAQKVIEDRYGRFINARKGQFSDEQNQSLQDQYINRFKSEAQAGSTKLPQDPKIAEWATQHGLDYDKASAILKKRGYGK